MLRASRIDRITMSEREKFARRASAAWQVHIFQRKEHEVKTTPTKSIKIAFKVEGQMCTTVSRSKSPNSKHFNGSL